MSRSLADWVARHPGRWGLVSGGMMILVGIALFRGENWPVCLVVGATFGALNALMWRSDGPAHRWRASLLRRFGPRP